MASTDISRNNSTQSQVATIPPTKSYQRTGTVNAGGVPTVINFPSATASVSIENTHATQDLYLYWPDSDGNRNHGRKTIIAGGVYSKDVRVTRLWLMGQANNTNYEIDATLE